jgi:hypothetical protein
MNLKACGGGQKLPLLSNFLSIVVVLPLSTASRERGVRVMKTVKKEAAGIITDKQHE